MGLRAWLREREEVLVKHRWLIITAAIVAGIVILLFGTKIYLLLNFLLGNDIVIKLDVNDTSVELANGETADIRFGTSVITNPFCSATCTATWEDVSSGTALDEQAFSLQPGNPVSYEYGVRAGQYGHGQKLYRYEMTCRSEPTLLCHTSGKPTKRARIIAVTYDLNSTQRNLKERFRSLHAGLVMRQELYEAERNATVQLRTLLQERIVTEPVPPKSSIDLSPGEETWMIERYDVGVGYLEDVNVSLTAAERELRETRERLNDIRIRWNDLVATLTEVRRELSHDAVLNLTGARLLNRTVDEYAGAVRSMTERRTIEEKETHVATFVRHADSVVRDVERQEARALLAEAVMRDIVADAVCMLNGTCLPHPDLSVRTTTLPSMDETCRRPTANATLSPGQEAFLQNVTNAYAEDIPDGPYRDILSDILVVRQTGNVTNVSDLPTATGCDLYDVKDVPPLELGIVEMPPVPDVRPDTSLPEPPATCCSRGTCTACCENCSDEHLPVMLLHGHAFNKDSAAEYSLDAFNDIQELLEDDGYIDAGTVSLYTAVEGRPGEWGGFRTPVSVRTSYYFDIFKEPENYVVVQTKSENIDTYAIRLKELIDTVQYKTGKDRVVIVAHSMGGLVARRYVQIFGRKDVAGLVLIATPNKGIVGSVAEYCSLIGERLECRDMNADSLFINKLNRQPTDVPIHNIVGSGCEMLRGRGDGIVLTENALMDDATNHVVNGTCQALYPLHTRILDMDRHPKVYRIVREAIASVS